MILLVEMIVCGVLSLTLPNTYIEAQASRLKMGYGE